MHSTQSTQSISIVACVWKLKMLEQKYIEEQSIPAQFPYHTPNDTIDWCGVYNKKKKSYL